ncbi:MAG: hypothetical protein JNJ41_09245 [Bacteroidia bacterium]|nr:hypothetical protein [Bacteroidia bacterium]
MIKKLLITTFVGTAIYFVFGWFVFEFVLGNYTSLNTTQLEGFKKSPEQSSLLFLIVSCTAYAVLMSYILVNHLNIKNLAKAFLIGSTVGVLVAVMADTYWYATTNFYSNFSVVVFDILGAGISVGTMGLAIAFVNKKLV